MIAFRHRDVGKVVASASRRKNRNGVLLQQRIHAANMIGMMVRDQNGFEPKRSLLERSDHRRRIARVDHDGVLVAFQEPDIIIRKSGNGQNFQADLHYSSIICC